MTFVWLLDYIDLCMATWLHWPLYGYLITLIFVWLLDYIDLCMATWLHWPLYGYLITLTFVWLLDYICVTMMYILCCSITSMEVVRDSLWQRRTWFYYSVSFITNQNPRGNGHGCWFNESPSQFCHNDHLCLANYAAIIDNVYVF